MPSRRRSVSHRRRSLSRKRTPRKTRTYTRGGHAIKKILSYTVNKEVVIHTINPTDSTVLYKTGDRSVDKNDDSQIEKYAFIDSVWTNVVGNSGVLHNQDATQVTCYYMSHWGATIRYKDNRLFYDEDYEIKQSSDDGNTYVSLYEKLSSIPPLNVNDGKDAGKSLVKIKDGTTVTLIYKGKELNCKLVSRSKIHGMETKTQIFTFEKTDGTQFQLRFHTWTDRLLDTDSLTSIFTL